MKPILYSILLAMFFIAIPYFAHAQFLPTTFIENRFGERSVTGGPPVTGGYMIVKKGTFNQPVDTKGINANLPNLNLGTGEYTLTAADQQNAIGAPIGTYPNPDNEEYKWNTNGAAGPTSVWLRSDFNNQVVNAPGTNTQRDYTFTLLLNSPSYKYIAWMKRLCRFQGKAFAEFQGATSSALPLDNPTAFDMGIAQPMPQTELTINGQPYNFMSWGKNDLPTDFSSQSNAQFVPIRSRDLHFFFKRPNRSSNASATGGGGQRRMAVDESSGRIFRVYQSEIYDGSTTVPIIVAHASTNNGATWGREQLIGFGSNPALDVKNGWVVISYLETASGITRVRTKFGVGSSNPSGIFINWQPQSAVTSEVVADTKPSVKIRGFLPVPEGLPEGDIEMSSIAVPEVIIAFDKKNGGNSQLVIAKGGRFQSYFFTETSLHSSVGSVLTNPAIETLSNNSISVVWQAGNFPYGDGIHYAEFNGSTFTTNFALPVDQTYQTVNYQFPTIAVSASGEKHIAWQAHNTWYNLSVVMYERLTSSNGTTPLTQLQLGYSNHYKPSINWAGGSTTILAESGSGTFAISKPDGQGFGSFTNFTGRAANIVASGSKRYCYTTGSVSPYQIQFGEISTGGGSAQERTLSGGNSGTISPVATTLGGTPTPSPSFQLAERVTARLSSEQASAFLELTLADVALNGISRTGLTFHHLGASLLEDSATLTPQNIFKKLKSRTFVVADSITQVSAVVKVRSESLYGLTSNANLQLAVELFNAETHQSLALSQTVFVSNADTAKDFHFTMTLPSSPRGTVAELRVKVLGFVPQSSHQPSVLNTITLLDSDGGTAILNRIGGALESVGSVPTKFALHQNYPNPFNPTTMIRYELTEASPVKLQVFDMLGRVVATVVNERRDAGIYEVPFNASGLSSGTYFYRLQAGTFIETKKMMLIK